MKTIAVSCYSDNYSWITYCEKAGEAVVFDACDGVLVIAALKRLQLTPVAVYCTHHHADHIEGVSELLAVWPQLRIFCHCTDRERIAGVTDGLKDGDLFHFCGRRGQVLHTPGHTRGSLCYLLGEYLFTGDTLFGAGCGRVFTGNFVQMADSLQRLAALPGNIRVCCGHEYTRDNLDFALFVEPENSAIIARRKAVVNMRRQGLATVPSLLEEELRTNPFLRCGQPEIAAITQRRFGAVDTSYRDVFTALRREKDRF